ncbi:MAG: DUF4349 domain-containing protein [Saccharofermentans sp.]|nr:DUF4349 domain-containing protein [Saccharofermentans sp.]
MKNSLRKTLITLLAVTLLVSGCSSTKSSKKSDSSSRDKSDVKETYAASEEFAYNQGMRGDEGFYEATIEDDSAMYDKPTSGTNGDMKLPTEQMLIRNINIVADTADFPTLSANVDAAVKANGGYYESMSVTGTGKAKDYRTGYFVIRVPSENLDNLINSLEGKFTVTSRNESTEDVTLQYVDVESRIKSLEIERDNLLEMLEQATELETIVYLQSELTDVRYELESYASQARVMEKNVSYSTLRLTLNEVIEEKQEEPIEVKREKTLKDDVKKEWSDTIDDLKTNGRNFLLWLVGNAIYIVVFIVIAVVVLIIAINKYKKIKKDRNNKKDNADKDDTVAENK